MDYATTYDTGERKRGRGINEDSVAIAVFEDGHREGFGPRAGNRTEQPTADGAADATTPRNRSVAAFALADGAGGHDAGDAASYLATTVACEELAGTAIRAARSEPSGFDVDVEGIVSDRPRAGELEAAVAEAIVAAHREIVAYAAESGEQAYTTIVAGIYANGRLHYGWVGDSRAYVVNGDRREIARLTKDHAVVEELHDAGEIDDVEALVHPRGNEITRALGGTGAEDPETATVDVDTNTVSLYADDVVLVTSDGLIDAQTDAPDLYDRYVEAERADAAAETVRERVVTDDEIRDRILTADSLDGAAADLVRMANDRGGKDNLSALLFRDAALPPTPAEGGLPVRAIDPGDVEDRETVILPED